MLEAASVDHQWLAFCQVDADTNHDHKESLSFGPRGELIGDTPHSYLQLGTATPWSIDAVLGYDSSGRFVVVQQANHVYLVDSVTGQKTDLTERGFDARADGRAFVPHRALWFAKGMLAYLAKPGADGSYSVHLLDLTTMQERQLSAGSGEVWRLRLSPTARFVVLDVIINDDNNNGKLDWPVAPSADGGAWRCGGPIRTYPAWLDRGDTVVTRVIDLKKGSTTDVADFAAPLGDGYLYRDKQGALWLSDDTGQKRLAEAKCNAHVVYADTAHEQALIACEGPKLDRHSRHYYHRHPLMLPFHWPLRLVSRTLNLDLKLTIGPTEGDRWPGPPRRLSAFYPGADSMLLDLDKQKALLLSPGDTVVQTWHNLALIRRNDSVVVYDADTGSSRTLATHVARLPMLLGRGHFGYVSPYLVDLEQQRIVGRYSLRPLSLSRDGLLLVPEGADATTTTPALGPLIWLRIGAASHGRASGLGGVTSVEVSVK